MVARRRRLARQRLSEVRVKRKRWQGQDLGAAPEYADCARLAREHGLPLREVYRMALERSAVAFDKRLTP